VRRWIRERGYAGPEEFVEEIPFEETRGYVKRVLGSYDRYRALYAESRVPAPRSQVELPGSRTPDGRQ
jgi:soluble lytic murein transglycosylase-like protein